MGDENGANRGNLGSAGTLGSEFVSASGHTADTRALLDTIRERDANGFADNAGTTSRSSGQVEQRTNVTSGIGTRTNAEDNAASTGDDRPTRSAAAANGRFGRAARTDSGSDGASTGEPVRDHSSTARKQPSGLVAAAPPKGAKIRKPTSEKNTILPWSSVARIDKKEIESLRDNLVIGLQAIFTGIDTLITQTNARKNVAYIWSGIDEEDCIVLANVLLNAGMKTEAVAWAVRGIVDAHEKYQIGAILLPRFLATVQFYADNGGMKLPLW